jgi:hypothetical protein
MNRRRKDFGFKDWRSLAVTMGITLGFMVCVPHTRADGTHNHTAKQSPNTEKMLNHNVQTSDANSANSNDGLGGAESRIILGWLEQAYVANIPYRLRAKLDTGAKTSSLHGKVMRVYERNGEKWLSIAFDWFNKKMMTNKNAQGRQKKQAPIHPYFLIEAPVVRQVKIKDHKRMSDIRWVTRLPLLIAGQCHTAEFSIADRKRFNYAILLGRNFIKDLALINSKETFVSSTYNKQVLQGLVDALGKTDAINESAERNNLPHPHSQVNNQPTNAETISAHVKRQQMYKGLASCDPVGISLTRITDDQDTTPASRATADSVKSSTESPSTTTDGTDEASNKTKSNAVVKEKQKTR